MGGLFNHIIIFQDFDGVHFEPIPVINLLISDDVEIKQEV